VAQGSGSFHRLIPDVITVSKDGRPFLEHAATVTSTGIDKPITSRHPGVLASSYPIKGQTRALQGATKNGQDTSQSQVPASKGTQLRDQHLKQSPPIVLFHFL
jgi:hypothetical protein